MIKVIIDNVYTVKFGSNDPHSDLAAFSYHTFWYPITSVNLAGCN